MTEFFPGSRQAITPPAGVPEDITIPPGFGRTFNLGGVEMRLFSLGELAELLNRRPVTVRLWERKGFIPKPTFVKPGPKVDGVEDKRGRRRYYSQAQVEALIRIAEDEKILHDLNAHITKTLFSKKAFHAFREIAGSR